MSSVQVQNVTMRYESALGAVTALENIVFDVKEGEFFAILGPSGCGKTTLLNLLAGFETPTSGTLLVDGEVVRQPTWDKTVVFQEYALFPWYTVYENISFGLEMKGVPESQRRPLIADYINLVGLQGFEHRYPQELSGGKRQRVGIARALAVQPRLLLMDEPLGALDAQTRAFMQGELLRIWEHERKTVIMVTHSLDEALRLADRVLVMTRRPGRMKAMYSVTQPRPRDETHPDLVRMRSEINALLQDEVKRMHEAEIDSRNHPGS